MIASHFASSVNYKKYTLFLILISTFLRMIAGACVELGNDEVYYWLYAKYPDISHFDHPPMVGFFIQFFTLNLFFDSEFFIRLAAILPASFNMYLLYLITKNLKDEKAGFLTVLLYNISIYGLVISGIFILPDAPLLTFGFLGFYYFLKSLPYKPSRQTKKYFLAAMIFIAFALYSKYQAVYFLSGGFLYILFFNRIWLKQIITYIGILFPLCSVALIVYWNYQYDFIGFKFHGDRVSLFGLQINWDSFLREFFGQILYNNPYILFLMISASIAYKKQKWNMNKNMIALFLFSTLPLIATVLYLSLYRSTLPHWSGISYLTLLPLLGSFLSQKTGSVRKLSAVLVLMFAILFLSIGVIHKGWLLPSYTHKDKTQVGADDFSMDLYGWEQSGKEIRNYIENNHSLKGLQIISNKWFPAAHLDYYVARTMKKQVYALGNLEDIHKYYWINQQQLPLKKEVLYITDSRNYKDPESMYFDKFHHHHLLKAIPIKRGNVVVKYVFMYKLYK